MELATFAMKFVLAAMLMKMDLGSIAIRYPDDITSVAATRARYLAVLVVEKSDARRLERGSVAGRWYEHGKKFKLVSGKVVPAQVEQVATQDDHDDETDGLLLVQGPSSKRRKEEPKQEEGKEAKGETKEEA